MNEQPSQATNPSTNEEEPQINLSAPAPETEEPESDDQEVETPTDAEEEETPEEGEEAAKTPEAPSNQTPPVASDKPPADDDDDYGQQILPQEQELPTFDPAKLPVDDNGLVDLAALGQQFNETMEAREKAFMQRIDQRQNAIDVERSGWNNVFKEHGEVEKDTALRDDIQAYRVGQYYRDGKLMSPEKAAEKFFQRFGAAKEAGIEQASVNKKVQKSAYNEGGARRQNSEEQRVAKLNEQMRSTDPTVREKASHDMLKRALFPNG